MSSVNLATKKLLPFTTHYAVKSLETRSQTVKTQLSELVLFLWLVLCITGKFLWTKLKQNLSAHLFAGKEIPTEYKGEKSHNEGVKAIIF